MFELFDKIYVINLKRRPDRLLEFFANNAPYLTKHNVEIFEATDGFLIEDEEWKFSKGSLGCYLTHLRLLTKLKNSVYQKVLILEDDALINQKEFLHNQEITDFIANATWDMFYLGGNHHKPPTIISENILKYNWGLTTHAYAINIKCLNQVLEYSQCRKYWIDGIFAELHSIMEVYGTVKQLMIQTNSKSDIEVPVKSNIYRFLDKLKLKLHWK